MLIIIALIILTEDFPMLVNYEILTVRLNRYLSEQYPDVTTHTDIFEHAFLRFLGYQSVPEKCLFEDNQPSHSLSIYLKAPYKLANSEFINDLRICATGDFSAIRIEEMNPNSNQGRFCVRLTVPYLLMNTHLSGIFQSIDKILADPLKMRFYCYWNIHFREFRFALTMIRIEELVREKLLHYPQMTFDDVWSAIIQKNTRKDFKVKFLEKKVSVDVNNFPKITLIYEENGEKNEIAMTRDQIVTTLAEETLNKFFIDDITLQEFITLAEISQFIGKKYHRFFSINTECHYEIDLGYHYAERKILEKYGIKELSSYRPNGDAPERTQIYVYDKENYQKSLLALKEIKGEKCFNERWHQLTYYIHHQRWGKLDKELKFLLNLKAETGVEIDYTELLIRLYQHARDNLQEEAQENTIEIIEKVCKYLVNTVQLKSEMQKEIDKILFELTLLRRNQLETSDETERLCLKKELFIYAQRIGLEESNHYLGEIAGLGFGNTFSEDVNKNPIAVLLEIAEKYKVAIEENARLKREGDKPSSQEVIASSNINKVSYFSRK